MRLGKSRFYRARFYRGAKFRVCTRGFVCEATETVIKQRD